jgi:hypothetical protein
MKSLKCLQSRPEYGNFRMPTKRHNSRRAARGTRSTARGHFKHTAEPASFASVLRTYGISLKYFKKLKARIDKELGPERLHVK